MIFESGWTQGCGLAYNSAVFGLLIRKTLYDLWDNFLSIAALNGMFLLIMLGFFQVPLLLVKAFPGLPVLSVAAAAVFVFLTGVYAGALAFSLKRVSGYGAFHFAEFAGSLKKALPLALAFTVFAALVFFFTKTIIPFYFNIKGFMGSFLGATVFWVLAALCLAAQLFPSIYARQDGSFRAKLKYSLFFMADNLPLYIGVFFTGILLCAVSIVFLFLWPGPAGLFLFWDEAFRLRFLKYEWLSKAGEEVFAKRRTVKIPWDEILEEEREATGKRTIRQIIFPWKQ